MTSRFRPYQSADKAACLALFDSNVPEFFDSSERAMFAEFLDGPRGAYHVLEEAGRITGCGGYAREKSGQARFTWGMVARSHHGRGLGRLLAQHRLDAIVKSGAFTEAELFTTPAVAPFFAKFGFEQRAVIKNGFAPGMDQVRMIKKLA